MRRMPVGSFAKTIHSVLTHQRTLMKRRNSFASHLINLLQELSVSDDYVVETEESLDKRDDEEPDSDADYQDNYEDDDIQESTPIDEGQGEEGIKECRSFTLNYMKKVIAYARPGIAFTTLQHAYPRIKGRKQLQRFRAYVERNGNHTQKLRDRKSVV